MSKSEIKKPGFKLANYFLLMRVHQWLKNFFIFLPVFFGKRIFDFLHLKNPIIFFFVFSLCASAVYCFNDIFDLEKDKIHPEKCKRPLASGKVSLTGAYITMVVCLCLAVLILLIFWNNSFWKPSLVILLYLILNFLYTLYLKKVSIVDVFIIASGFVLRVIVGGKASSIELSPWIILMTFLLALFLAFAKRRDDLNIKKELGLTIRENTKTYTHSLLDAFLSILSAITFVCYVMYTMSSEVMMRLNSKYVYTTSVFVLAGLLRYLQITLVEGKSSSPTAILMKDRFIQICILLWICLFYFIIYWNK